VHCPDKKKMPRRAGRTQNCAMVRWSRFQGSLRWQARLRLETPYPHLILKEDLLCKGSTAKSRNSWMKNDRKPDLGNLPYSEPSSSGRFFHIIFGSEITDLRTDRCSDTVTDSCSCCRTPRQPLISSGGWSRRRRSRDCKAFSQRASTTERIDLCVNT